MIKNKIKEYVIKNYVYFELPDGQMIVQSTDGIIKTKEERLKKLFKFYDEKKSREIKLSDIEEVFFDDTDEVIKFLEENGLIERKKEFNLGVEKIKIFSDNTNIQELLLESLNDSNDTMEIVKGNYNPEKKTAVIVILNDYNKKTAKSIRNLYLERDDSYLLMTYVYNGNFYIDSLYIGAFKMPCHLCQISNIETNIRNLSSDSLTYQHILDTIYSEFEDISTSYPLDKSQILNIATMLTNNINKLITLKDDPVVFQEELSYSTMMNLKSKEVVVDTPIHWDLCDCYE